MSLSENPLFWPGVAFPFAWSGRPARMAVRERVLWTWFFNHFPGRFDYVWFDVHIPRDTSRTYTDFFTVQGDEDPTAFAFRCGLCLRADVVARVGGRYTVIELRSLPVESSFAQVLRYTEMLRGFFPSLVWTRPILIADDVRPYMDIGGSYSDVELVIPPVGDIPKRLPASSI
jgi:hypothetical protein